MSAGESPLAGGPAAGFAREGAASLSMSTGFGRYSVDPVKHSITFKIDRSSVPNSDDTTAVRQYELHGDELTWRVAPRKDGSVPLTTLRRVAPNPQ